mgnify:CR=1 FL=1
MEHHIDAKDKILGRLATQVAVLLRGKHTAQFDPAKLPNHQVTVYNTDFLKVSGKKMEQKIYLRHTGYHGGQRAEALQELMARDSRLAMRRAVMGMLPKNRLRSQIIKNLVLLKREPKTKI